MKRLVLVFIAVLLMTPAISLAQADDVDIAAVSEQVASVDGERLLMRLNTPIPAELLPEEFSDPRPLEATTLAEQRARIVENLPGVSGSAFYTVEYMPQAISTAPSPMADASPAASPAARGPLTAFTSGTLTYLTFDAPVDISDLEGFGSTIQAALGTDAQAGTIEQITINDAPAVLVSSLMQVNALDFHTEWIAIPVGNVVVIAMITEGSDTFDEERFRDDNEALAVAGVAYLQMIVTDMGAA